MRKFSFVFVLISVFALTAAAQDKQKDPKAKARPDPTGSWMLDRQKSNLDRSVTPDLPLKIIYRDPELKIIRSSERDGKVVEREFVYYTDERGESNPATMILSTNTNTNAEALDKQMTKSTTRWSGNKLVTTAILRSVIAGHQLEFEVKDEWKLSEDGKTLTQTSRTVYRPGASLFIPANVPETKRVYNRVPD